MSKIDDVFRNVLNDDDIFESKYDFKRKGKFPKLFEVSTWKQLGERFTAKDEAAFLKIIEERIQTITKKQAEYGKWERDLKRQADWLKKAYREKPYLLADVLANFSWYGAMECNLPAMDSYGKVIERYDRAIVETFFMEKISKEMDRDGTFNRRGKALTKALEYVKELYDAEVSVEEIAYFVRKLNALKEYWEVIA